MDRSYPYSRRLVTRARLRKRMAAVTAAGLVGATTLFMLTWKPDPISAALPAAPLLALVDGAMHADGGQPAAPGMRRIYPYSVVPGGVSGQAELKRVIRTDRVVAAHYASFDVDKARPVVVEKPRAVHVSYRKGDKVYWTARKVMLAEGETLLSDGSNEMRARCANRISDVPQYPVEAHQPAMEELDQAIEVDAGDQVAFGADGLPVSMGEDGATGRHAGPGVTVLGGGGGSAPGSTAGSVTLASNNYAFGAPGSPSLSTMGLWGSSSSLSSRPRPSSTPASSPSSGGDGSGSSSTGEPAPGGSTETAPVPETSTGLPAVDPLPDGGSGLPAAPNPPSGGLDPLPGVPGTPLPGTTPTPGSDPLPGLTPDPAPPGGQQSGGGSIEQPLIPEPGTDTEPFIPKPDLGPPPPQSSTEPAPDNQVPEPGSLWLMAPALLGLAGIRSRRRRGA